jgi:hypothetical protein
MIRHATALATLGLVLCAGSAEAGTAFAFTVQNDTAAPMTVFADGKSKCDVAPGGSCRVMVASADTAFAYSKPNGEKIAFDPGNLESVDLCKVDTNGAHCVDPNATPAP